MKLIIKTHFDAAHRLENYDGACARLHGHTWWVEVEVPVKARKKGGYYPRVTMDFKRAKEVVNALLPDHDYINDLAGFNPTAENIALYLKRECSRLFKAKCVVRVWESPNAAAQAGDEDD